MGADQSQQVLRRTKQNNSAVRHVELLESRALLSASGHGDLSATSPIATPAAAYTFDLATLRTPPSSTPRAAAQLQITSGPIVADDVDDLVTGAYSGRTDFLSINPVRAEPSGGVSLTGGSFAHYSGRPPRTRVVPSRPEFRGRVLVIEDDEVSRNALTVILARRGWDVTAAATLSQGMSGLRARPDSVVLDLMLPDGDGVQVLQYVRAAHLNMRVVVTTASSNANRLARVKNLHPDALMSKPIDVVELVRSLSGPAN